MFKENLKNLKEKSPLVHNITNYVTVNDCANILLACGGSPIMADDENEVADITSICNGLNINIGTLNQRTISSMIIAGKKANELNHIVLLDPVGVGASTLRNETAKTLLEEIKFSIIRGNISEIKTLALGSGKTKGVDATIEDIVTKNNLDATIQFAKDFSKNTGAIIVITGAIDIVANSEKAYVCYNGSPRMSKVTGTGCMLSAMTTAFACANSSNLLDATFTSVCSMGLCGEIAEKRLSEFDGNMTYRNYIIDAIYNLNGDVIESGAKYEVR
ncbi:MAG: hydroxyethylthiazole kinase [Lachnospirales bacterium]